MSSSSTSLWPQIITAAATLAASLGTLMVTGHRDTRRRREDRRREEYTRLIDAARAVLDYVGTGRQLPRNVSNGLYLAVTAVQITGSRRASRAAGAMWDVAGLPTTAVRLRRVGGSAPPVPGQPLESGTELDMAVARFVAVAQGELGGDSWLNRQYRRLRSWWLRFRHRHGWVRQQLALEAPDVGSGPEPPADDEGG